MDLTRLQKYFDINRIILYKRESRFRFLDVCNNNNYLNSCEITLLPEVNIS